MGLLRAGVSVALVLLLVAGCSEEPDVAPPEPPAEEPAAAVPQAGLRVGVVLPPGDPSTDRELGYLQTDLRGLGATLPSGISELRLVVPDDAGFVADFAHLLLQRDVDLLCVIGPEGRRTVTELADLVPQRDYCALPASSSSPPDAITLVDVRFEEVGHAVGVVAALHAGDAPVAAVIGDDRIGRERFLQGLRAAVGTDHLLERAPNGAENAVEAVREVLAEGAAVVVVDVGAGAAEAVALAAEEAAVAVPSSSLAGGAVTDAALLTWRLRWDVVLRRILTRLVEPDTDVPAAVGLTDDVLRLSPGSALDAGDRAELEVVVGELRDGVLDPLEPRPRPDDPADTEPATRAPSEP